MSSVSSVGFSQQAFLSPRVQLQNELTSQVSAGKVSSADQSALSSAIDDIDSTLRGEGQAARVSGARPPSPSDLQSKIDSLIAKEVSDGKLTSEQADELKSIFANGLPQGGPGGGGGLHGPGGPGGPGGPRGAGGPGGPGGGGGASEAGEADETDDSNDTDETSISELLEEFIKLLQQNVNASSNYGSDGSSSASITAFVVNIQV